MQVGAKLAAGAAAIAIGLAAAPQALGVTAYETHIGISNHAPAFHGHLDAGSPLCVNNRRVGLYREKSGGDKKIGSTHSDAMGDWSILEDQFVLKSGAYYAKANASLTPAGDRCRKDRSRVVVVD